MQLSRLAGLSVVLAAFGAATIVACGGGTTPSGGDDQAIDAPAGNHDAPGSNIDAPGSGSNTADGIGKTCTPGSTPQGDCPVGFTCLNLQGGTNAWCSKSCTGQADTSCASGYTGPGKPECVLGVSGGSGSAVQMFCDVICEDDTGSNQICPAATCNDTCPGSLACAAPLKNGSGTTVAKACD